MPLADRIPRARLLRNAEAYAPEYLGVVDVLVLGSRVAAVGPRLEAPGPDCEVVDLEGRRLAPGLVDQHVHITGGGGEDGFASRTPAIRAEDVALAGVTTLAGVLGTDGLSRSVEDLLAKAAALEAEGLTVYAYTGSYALPTVTLTGSVGKDIAYLDRVVGVKTAISDHRSSNPSAAELVRLASEARVAGLLSGKAGIVHIHVGSGKAGLGPVFDALAMSDLPARQFSPTHVGRSEGLFAEALRLAGLGGMIDLTADGGAPSMAFSTAAAVAACPPELRKRLTISSDGNGSAPVFGPDGSLAAMGIGSQRSLLETVRVLVEDGIAPLAEALALVTVNPAENLGLSGRKGRIAPGYDADFLVLGEGLSVEGLLARGRWLAISGRAATISYYPA